jgi:hypothetical protein
MSQSTLNKFMKKQYSQGQNPVDWFNENPDYELIFEKVNKTHEFSEEDLTLYQKNTKRDICGLFSNGKFKVLNSESFSVEKGEYTPTQLLSALKFKNNYRMAIQLIEMKFFNDDLPYIRVGTDYFKRIEKTNRYGISLKELKKWNKDTIKQDHGESVLNRISLFDDFTIEPNNLSYSPVIDGMWNLYEPFPHKQHDESVSIERFPTTASFMAHVFGDQIELGYQYMKVLYEFPKQILPVLVLVSKERQTGKTTFLNWLDMIFGNNYVMVTPDDVTNSFNSTYAYKNIIGIDEAVVDRVTAVEKVKSIATAKTMTVNEKMVAQYRIPFFGKLVITTNRESDFMKVDSEEIRFWVRKLNEIPANRLTVDYEQRLIDEIPFFLKYLTDKIQVNFGKSRMVFTSDQISNNELETVKKESFSGLRKEITVLVQEFFKENPDQKEFYATLKDLKNKWFDRDSRISTHYLKKVMQDEIKMNPSEKLIRYLAFDRSGSSSPGTPYLFKREDFIEKEMSFTLVQDADEDPRF